MTDHQIREVFDAVPDGLFIAGLWRASAPQATLEVSDPATGEVIKTVADASPEDGIAALDAADSAAAAWAATSLRDRAELLRRAFDLL